MVGAVLADSLGLGGSSDFGWKQAFGLMAGLAVTVAGVAELGGPRRRAEPRGRRRALVDGLQLAALSAFAVAQPLFDLLADNAEFFVARRSVAGDILVFAFGVTLVPPAAMLVLELLAAAVRPRFRRPLHLFFLACLTGIIALQALNELASVSHQAALLAAAYLGAGAALAYRKIPAVRSFLMVLSPAPILFLALFVFSPQISRLLFEEEARAGGAQAATRAPVVMIVFDEFPTTSLLRRRDEIDAERYPNFARFASGSTWFRNATTISDNTTYAVPAILTGKVPSAGLLPNSTDHPGNLFTLLANSHRLEVFERITGLCPRRLCVDVPTSSFASRMRSLASDLKVVYQHLVLPEDLRDQLPDIGTTWGDFRDRGRQPTVPPSGDERHRWDTFVESIAAGERPSLHFLHVLLPHWPWQYLPSGRSYPGALRLYGGSPNAFWGNDAFLVAQGRQRHLLQVGFVDRLVGRLIGRLRATGLYDRSLIVLVADHGASFRPGGVRRAFTEDNTEEMAPVPLFIKAPHQKAATVVDKHVRTIDVLPTIAELLDVRVPWKTDGRSMLDPAYPDRRRLVVRGDFGAGRIVIDVPVLDREREAERRRQNALLVGRDVRGVLGFGPPRSLLGQRVEDVPADRAVSARIDQASELGHVDPGSGAVPVLVTGGLVGAHRRRRLAVAVNGRVAALARSFRSNGMESFSALVPESTLHAGANDVRILALPAG
jgi:hypothetical protein